MAEYYATLRSANLALGFRNVAADLGADVKQFFNDGPTALDIIGRGGLGKVRHLDVQDLWIQQRLRNGHFSLYKIKGDDNPGDLFTKASLTYSRIEALLTMLGCINQEGRAESAPALKHKGSERKVLEVERRPRWSDENEAEMESSMSYRERDMGEAKALEMLKELGFPHARRASYQSEVSRQACPEIDENEDPMTREGEEIGRYNRGRRGLSRRRTPQLRGSKEYGSPTTAARSSH